MKSNNGCTGALVMAAGLSERFGSNKLLHPLPNGNPLLFETLSQLKTTKIPIHVITHSRQIELCQRLNIEPLTFSVTAPEKTGLGFSIAQGIEDTAHWGGWIICLADMPFVQASTYRSIRSELINHSLVKPYYQGQGGNPVGFGAQYRNQLLDLSGDTGARKIIQQQQCHRLDIDDPGILRDIDRPTDIDIDIEYRDSKNLHHTTS